MAEASHEVRFEYSATKPAECDEDGEFEMAEEDEEFPHSDGALLREETARPKPLSGFVWPPKSPAKSSSLASRNDGTADGHSRPAGTCETWRERRHQRSSAQARSPPEPSTSSYSTNMTATTAATTNSSHSPTHFAALSPSFEVSRDRSPALNVAHAPTEGGRSTPPPIHMNGDASTPSSLGSATLQRQRQPERTFGFGSRYVNAVHRFPPRLMKRSEPPNRHVTTTVGRERRDRQESMFHRHPEDQHDRQSLPQCDEQVTEQDWDNHEQQQRQQLNSSPHYLTSQNRHMYLSAPNSHRNTSQAQEQQAHMTLHRQSVTTADDDEDVDAPSPAATAAADAAAELVRHRRHVFNANDSEHNNSVRGIVTLTNIDNGRRKNEPGIAAAFLAAVATPKLRPTPITPHSGQRNVIQSNTTLEKASEDNDVVSNSVDEDEIAIEAAVTPQKQQLHQLSNDGSSSKLRALKSWRDREAQHYVRTGSKEFLAKPNVQVRGDMASSPLNGTQEQQTRHSKQLDQRSSSLSSGEMLMVSLATPKKGDNNSMEQQQQKKHRSQQQQQKDMPCLLREMELRMEERMLRLEARLEAQFKARLEYMEAKMDARMGELKNVLSLLLAMQQQNEERHPHDIGSDHHRREPSKRRGGEGRRYHNPQPSRHHYSDMNSFTSDETKSFDSGNNGSLEI